MDEMFDIHSSGMSRGLKGDEIQLTLIVPSFIFLSKWNPDVNASDQIKEGFVLSLMNGNGGQRVGLVGGGWPRDAAALVSECGSQ
eukprot:scaffold896_cov172-Amphora_coffeaeformis.AAC.4